MSYLVLARKWRPQGFNDLTGQESVARILRNALTGNKVAHAYIFSGPRGVGKTTTARILAKALNCEKGPTPDPCGKCPSCLGVADGSSIDVTEIDGASNTGVDNIRDLREKVRYAPSAGRYKVYIIDEAHMLSTSAFNALLKTLEEPPPHVIFVLATTEPKKIPPTVLSRCQHLPFSRISALEIKERLKSIAGREGIKIAPSPLDMIARAADGSMRDALTLLDQIASFSDDITASDVRDLLGVTEVETLAKLSAAVIEGNSKEIITLIAALTYAGTDLKIFTRDLLQFTRNLLISKITTDTEGILDLSEQESSAIAGIRDTSSEEHFALMLSELIKAEPGIRSAIYPRIALEMTLLKLGMLSRFKSIDEALRLLQGPGSKLEPDMQRNTSTSHAHSGLSNSGLSGSALSDSALSASDSSASDSFGSGLSGIWDAVIDKIDTINHPLASKMRDGDASFGANDIRIVFTGGSALHAESVEENLPLIKKLLAEIAGTPIGVSIGTAEAAILSRKDLKEAALQNPIVQDALELFEGRIVDVLPAKEEKT
jgi:DNA polymerase-3 subunit gamma/tau